MSQKGNLVKIGAVWITETKNGDDMLSMSIRLGDEEFSCVAFSNDYKKESKHPDFLIYANQDEMETEKETEAVVEKKTFGKKKFGGGESKFKSQSGFKKKSPFV